MGVLITTKYCLSCHEHQGYKLGDVRGGISVGLDSTEYLAVTASMKTRVLLLKIFVVILFFSIFLLIFKQLRYSQKLQDEVNYRTKEIESTKQLLQEIIDTDSSFIVLTEGENVIYANKTMLDFSGYKSIEEFKKNYEYMSDVFEKVYNDNNFIQTYNDGIYWTEYLIKEQNSKELKICIKKDNNYRYFKPLAKEIKMQSKVLYLITFDEITMEYVKIKELEKIAATDALTNLFNRNKLNDVLEKEISLSQTTLSPLCVVFLDIDHFKVVNDTYGHNIGDEVLIALSNIITSSIRIGDIAARWGGEEFMIILQATSITNAYILGEKLRVKVEENIFETAGKITISLGITEYINGESEETFMQRVDEALYEAKESGRNKTIVK